ncbi:hypothetical protein J3Q64DRAFT_1721781, partial [Phycomyces blakesleeanus]
MCVCYFKEKKQKQKTKMMWVFVPLGSYSGINERLLVYFSSFQIAYWLLTLSIMSTIMNVFTARSEKKVYVYLCMYVCMCIYIYMYICIDRIYRIERKYIYIRKERITKG